MHAKVVCEWVGSFHESLISNAFEEIQNEEWKIRQRREKREGGIKQACVSASANVQAH